jgi:hypothetical protein
MSHQATFLGHFKEAANMARAARLGADRVSTPILSAHFYAMRVIHGGWELAGLHMQVSISERRRRLL